MITDESCVVPNAEGKFARNARLLGEMDVLSRVNTCVQTTCNAGTEKKPNVDYLYNFCSDCQTECCRPVNTCVATTCNAGTKKKPGVDFLRNLCSDCQTQCCMPEKDGVMGDIADRIASILEKL